MKKLLFISIKPEFVDKILNKQKLIELRKNKPNSKVGDYVIIYSTQPDKAIVGFARIKSIIESSPDLIWKKYSKILGIDKERFFKYYLNREKAIGIELSSVCKLKTSISLNEIKSHYPKFSPPQTYKYIPYYTALRVFKSFA